MENMDSLESFVTQTVENSLKEKKAQELKKILEELDEEQKVQYVSYEITSNV